MERIMSHSEEEETVSSLAFSYQPEPDAEPQPLGQPQHWDPSSRGSQAPLVQWGTLILC